MWPNNNDLVVSNKSNAGVPKDVVEISVEVKQQSSCVSNIDKLRRRDRMFVPFH